MQEPWKDTNDLNKALGDDFDLVTGWAAFNKKKEKERPIPFWFLGACLMLGVTLVIGLCFYQNKLAANASSATIDASILVEKNSSIAVSSLKLMPDYMKGKEQIINEDNGGTIADSSSKDLKILESQQVRKQITLTRSSLMINYAITPNTFTTQHLTQKTKKHPLNQPIKNNVLARKKTKQLTTKSFFPKRKTMDYLPIFLKPLVIKERIIPAINPILSTHKIIPIPYEKWTLDLTYTYNRPKRKINGSNETYQNLRQTGEQFLEQQQIDLSITRSINRVLFLKTGLSYGRYRSRLVEKIQVLQSPVTYDNVVIETQTQNNITNEIKGTTIGSQLSINQSTRHQLYQTLAIPIQLGIQLPLKQDWKVSVFSGIAFNVWQHTSGNTYASQLPDGLFQPVSGLGYRSWGTVENISNLQIQRKIAKQLSLSLGLQAKFDVTNRLQNNQGVSDKWRSYGLSIGISKTW